VARKEERGAGDVRRAAQGTEEERARGAAQSSAARGAGGGVGAARRGGRGEGEAARAFASILAALKDIFRG
jgi:hypothetical protein